MHVTLTLMFGTAKNREMGFKTFENAMASHPARQNIYLKSPLSALQNNQQIEKLMRCGA